MKSIRIDTVRFNTGDVVDWMLMKKNLKNHKVDFVDSSMPSSINFTNKIQSLSVEEYEHMIFNEVQELHTNKDLADIDPLILDFCQFISLKSVDDHLKYAAPPFLGKRAPLTSNKTLKEDYVYFYQSSEGVNSFMHPLDLDYLMEYYGDVNELPAQLTARVSSVQKIVQRAHHRKFWPQFSHVNLNFDYDIVQVALEDLVEDYEPESYAMYLKELDYELKIAEANQHKHSSKKKKLAQSEYDDFDNYYGEGYPDAEHFYQMDALEEIIVKKQGLHKAVNCKRGGNPGKGGKKKQQASEPVKDNLNYFEEKNFQEIINRINQGEDITTANLDQYRAPPFTENRVAEQQTPIVPVEANPASFNESTNSQSQVTDTQKISENESGDKLATDPPVHIDGRGGPEKSEMEVAIKKSKKKGNRKYNGKHSNQLL
jgi:hypothetical protein